MIWSFRRWIRVTTSPAQGLTWIYSLNDKASIDKRFALFKSLFIEFVSEWSMASMANLPAMFWARALICDLPNANWWPAPRQCRNVMYNMQWLRTAVSSYVILALVVLPASPNIYGIATSVWNSVDHHRLCVLMNGAFGAFQSNTEGVRRLVCHFFGVVSEVSSQCLERAQSCFTPIIIDYFI